MSEIDFYHKPNYIKSLSKDFKQNQTYSEKILRGELKWKKLNWRKFHRQKPLFVYREDSWYDRFLIADFYYHPIKLIIELDWWIHDKKQIRDYDKMREYLLRENWYQIIRFKNEEVLKNVENVLEKISEKILLLNKLLPLKTLPLNPLKQGT